MAAGNHQTQERRLQLRIGQVVCRNVAPDVMDGDQRHIQRHGRSLGKIHTHQHRADEARGIGYCHGINIPAGQVGIFQSLVCKAVDGFDMFPGCNLRHHAAVFPVEGNLGCDAVGEHFPPIPDDGHSSFIAGGFNCQNVHFATPFAESVRLLWDFGSNSYGFRFLQNPAFYKGS